MCGEAAEELQKVQDLAFWAPSPETPLALLALARATAEAGDLAASRHVHQDLLARFQDAYPDLPVVRASENGVRPPPRALD